MWRVPTTPGVRLGFESRPLAPSRGRLSAPEPPVTPWLGRLMPRINLASLEDLIAPHAASRIPGPPRGCTSQNRRLRWALSTSLRLPVQTLRSRT